MFPIHPVRIAHGVWIAVLASVMLPVLLLAGCSREAAVPAAEAMMEKSEIDAQSEGDKE